MWWFFRYPRVSEQDRARHLLIEIHQGTSLVREIRSMVLVSEKCTLALPRIRFH